MRRINLSNFHQVATSEKARDINRVVAEKRPRPSATRITPVDELAHPRLRGVIALVLQKHFVAPSVA
jgi:hypothetical protein